MLTSSESDIQRVIALTLKAKVDVFKLKLKRKRLLEEIYRSYFEGEIDIKKKREEKRKMTRKSTKSNKNKKQKLDIAESITTTTIDEDITTDIHENNQDH